MDSTMSNVFVETKISWPCWWFFRHLSHRTQDAISRKSTHLKNDFAWRQTDDCSSPWTTCSWTRESALTRGFSATTVQKKLRTWVTRTARVTLTSQNRTVRSGAATAWSRACSTSLSRCACRGRSKIRRSFPRSESAREIAGFGCCSAAKIKK